VVVEGCGSDSLQGDVRFAKVMEMLGAKVEWSPYSIRITGPKAFGNPIQVGACGGGPTGSWGGPPAVLMKGQWCVLGSMFTGAHRRGGGGHQTASDISTYTCYQRRHGSRAYLYTTGAVMKTAM
jgi:hypothetical protein